MIMKDLNSKNGAIDESEQSWKSINDPIPLTRYKMMLSSLQIFSHAIFFILLSDIIEIKKKFVTLLRS